MSPEAFAADLAALFFSRPSVLSLCGQERLCFTEVLQVRALEYAASCYVEEQVKEVPSLAQMFLPLPLTTGFLA